MATKITTPAQKKPEQTGQASRSKPAENQSRRKWLFAAASIILAAAIFHMVKLKHVIVPAELIGIWKTSNANYKDRALEIGGVSVSFSTGSGTEYTGFIDHIESEPDKSGAFYTIYYRVDGNTNQITVYYDRADGGTLVFKNQPNVVWKKESSS